MRTFVRSSARSKIATSITTVMVAMLSLASIALLAFAWRKRESRT